MNLRPFLASVVEFAFNLITPNYTKNWIWKYDFGMEQNLLIATFINPIILQFNCTQLIFIHSTRFRFLYLIYFGHMIAISN